MRTLNEVIEAIEVCRDSYVAGKIIKSDALRYLKEYWEKQNILKGKWQITSIKGETWGVCSNCGFKQKAGELNFCLNCGVDMRGNDGTNKN